MELTYTAQNMNFSIKDFVDECDQIRSKLRIWSHLLKKFLMENFIYCTVISYWKLALPALNISESYIKIKINLRSRYTCIIFAKIRIIRKL